VCVCVCVCVCVYLAESCVCVYVYGMEGCVYELMCVCPRAVEKNKETLKDPLKETCT
jgi:hypothetical protein